MSRSLSLPVQEFIRSCERIARFASKRNGLSEDDCQAVTLHAIDLLWDLEANCLDHHTHDHFEDDSKKRAA